jgi:hypothetical protein
VTSMASTPEVVEPLKEEAIVYFVVSPDSGQGHRIYADEDIQALERVGSSRKPFKIHTE